MSYPPLIDLRIGFWPVVHFIRPCSWPSKVSYCGQWSSLLPFQIVSYPPLIDLRIGFWPVVHFIRPCSLFPIDNLSIYAQNFFKFCIHIVIGDEWYGIVNGQNPIFFDGVTALSPFKKWFLTCFSFTVYDIWMKLHRYVEQQRLHITTKDRHSYLSSSWVICPWLILSISVLLLFRHNISHKITFGAPAVAGYYAVLAVLLF